MYPSQLVISPVEVRARKRRAQWEAERLAELAYRLADGLITPAEAKERGL